MMRFPRTDLKLAMPGNNTNNTAVSSTSASSAVTDSVKSSPASSLFKRSRGKDSTRSYGTNHSAPSSPELTSLPQFPEEEGSKKGFFPSLRSRKSSSNVRDHDDTAASSPDQGVPASEPFDYPALKAARGSKPPSSGLMQPDLHSASAPSRVKPIVVTDPSLPPPLRTEVSMPPPLRTDKEMPPLPTGNRSESSLASYSQARPTATIPFSASTRNLTSSKDGNRPSFFGRFKATSSRASDGIKKAAAMISVKKAGRRGSRSGSASGTGGDGRPLYEDNYLPRLLVLPLGEQVRMTRPKRPKHRLVDPASFWLPALAHRCLEFLKCRGCQEEGLFRVPGAVPVVKHWYQRFDKEGDVDLLRQDVPDHNSIGSLLKQWLRELPTEILPREVQLRTVGADPAATRVPQLMVEELSNLPPSNYHLLRGITGLLSQLIEAEATTRMNFEAVRTCMSSLRVEPHCLKFLVTQWEDCWGGCKGEESTYQEVLKEMKGLGLITDAQMVAAEPPPELDQVQPQSPFRANFS